jgi:hypothetical protein
MALKGALDAEYRMERDEQGTIRMVATKMKDAPEPEPMAFRLRQVELDLIGEDGNSATSAVLDPVEYVLPPKAGKAGRGPNQTLAMQCLKERLSVARSRLEASGGEPDEARVLIQAWRDDCAKAGIGRQRFPEVKDSLERAGSIRLEGDYVTAH